MSKAQYMTDAIKIVSYTEDHVPNGDLSDELPWQDYHSVRNAIVKASRRFGRVGPYGVVKITPDVVDPLYKIVEPGFWEKGDEDPVNYYLPITPPNSERYCYVEVFGETAMTLQWLEAVIRTLKRFEGWGLGISNIPFSYILIFNDRVMVNGELSGCKSLNEVATKAQQLLLFSSPIEPETISKRWWQFWR